VNIDFNFLKIGAKWMACSNIPGGEAEDLACGEGLGFVYKYR